MREAAPVRAAVVGAGHMGRLHALAWSRTPGAELIGVVDIAEEPARRLAAETGCEVLGSLAQLTGRVDAVSVAVPTRAHHEVASQLLEAGLDVLVEKPLAPTLEEARRLVDRAARGQRILMVGHTERFNPVVRAVAGVLRRPRFVEVHRLAPFTERGTDVDVILDLMIHDLDLLAHFVGTDVRALDAAGVPVLTAGVDIANARIRFASGAVANLTASRVSIEKMRKIRFFEPDLYVSLDMLAREARAFRLVRGGAQPRIEAVDLGALPAEEPIAAEILAFVRAVRERREPPVSGREALEALELAHRVRAAIEEQLADAPR